MLNYTSLFADLEGLFDHAGRDPASFRRFAREVQRVNESLAEYCNEVASDYVIRLEQRLRQPDSQLSDEEINLLRSFFGLAPADPRRDQRLVDDLARVQESLGHVMELKERSLSLKSLDALRRLLVRMETTLPGIVSALEEREALREFERAVGQGAEGTGELDRPWLLKAIRQSLDVDIGTMSEESSITGFGSF